MSDVVFNRIFTIAGDRGTGKTPFIMGGDFEPGMAATYRKKGMSLLVIDTLDHPKYRSLPTIMPKDFKKLGETTCSYRCLATPENINKGVIPKLNDVWNTLIVFEDCYKYMKYSISDKMRIVIADSKQQNNDLAYMFACWAWVPLDLCRVTDYYVIFPTSDTPDVKGIALGGCYDRAMKAHQDVMLKKSPYLVIASGV